jgi:hypothetical protein
MSLFKGNSEPRKIRQFIGPAPQVEYMSHNSTAGSIAFAKRALRELRKAREEAVATRRRAQFELISTRRD